MSPGNDKRSLSLDHVRPSALAWLLVFSVLLRIVIAFYLGDEVPPPYHAPDDTSYSYLAERLADGYGFSFDRPWYPFGKPAGYPTAHWSFLYTLYVGSIYAIAGPHPLVVRLVGAVLGGVLLPFMSYRLTRHLFPTLERVPLIAAACTAFYAFFVLFAARLMTETYYIVGLLWTLERGFALAERPSLLRAVTLGLALGITTLLRQSILPWAVLLFVWLLWAGWRSGRFRPMFNSLVVAGMIVIMTIVPFTIRNYVTYGDFLLLNSNAGYAMYSAQHPMHGTSFQEYAAAPLPEDLDTQGLDEPQLDRELMRRGIGYVLDDPGRYLLLSLSRVRDYFEFWPTTDTSPLYNLGRVASIGVFLPFMLYGLWLAIRRYLPLRALADWAHFSTTPLALLLLFMIFYSLLHVFTWAMSRYRLPVDAVALSFAALALWEIWGSAPVSALRRHGAAIRQKWLRAS